MYPEVKFPREIHEGTKGDDVIAHKRAISRWNPDVYKWVEFTDFAGPYFIQAVLEFKKEHGLGSVPKIGTSAHVTLEKAHSKYHPSDYAFDAYAVKLAEDFYNEWTENKVRNSIVAAGFFWYAHRAQIAYSQIRPFEVGKPPFVPSAWDCSAFVTNCHYAGGVADPNGLGYNHEGYTGTLMDHGTKVHSVDDLSKGDLIFYGFSEERPGFHAGDPTHVALYAGDGMVISNGHHPIIWTKYTYRNDLNHFRHYDLGV
jgi:hypothetical protein